METKAYTGHNFYDSYSKYVEDNPLYQVEYRVFRDIINDYFKYLRDDDVSHTQFYKNTLEQFKNAGINNKMLRSFCRSLITCAWFIYNYNEYIVTHGGISARMITPLLSDNTYVYGNENIAREGVVIGSSNILTGSSSSSNIAIGFSNKNYGR